MTLIVETKNRHINKVYLQREKPTGFSLCCFLLFFFLLFSSQLIYSQSTSKEILQQTLNGNFNQYSLEETVLQDNNTNDTLAAAAIISITIEAFLKATPEKIKIASNYIKNTLDRADNSPYTKLFAYTAKSLLKALDQEYISALYSSLKGYETLAHYIKTQNCIEPEIWATAKVFNTSYGKIPTNYLFLLNVAGIDSLPLNEKKECSVKKHPELTAFIDMINQTLLDKDTLLENKSTPAVGHLLAAAHYLKKQLPKQASQHLMQIDSTGNQPTTQFYYHGVVQLNLGHYDKANWYLNKYLFLQQKGRYIKSALLRKKWIAIIQNQSYQHLDDAIENRGTTYTFSDRQALKEYRDQYHPRLLEARICFDGGRYSDALKVLNSINTKNLTHHRLNEYHYRKARSYQLLKQYETALDEYGRLLKMPNDGHYYHKKAMLERGKIFLELGNTPKAYKSLKQVMQVKSNMYSKVIEHEAEMLFEKIKNRQE